VSKAGVLPDAPWCNSGGVRRRTIPGSPIPRLDRSSMDFFAKSPARRRDGIHKSVSELSVNVDDKLAGKEPE